MIRWRSGVVVAERSRWAGAVEYDVRLPPENAAPDDGRAHAPPSPSQAAPPAPVGPMVRGLAYLDVVGEPRPGDRVLLNVSALQRGLGTGGMALIVAVPDRLPADPAAGPGHVVKARYTPLQTMVLGVDEQESPHHEALRDADSLEGMPVVVADLHSALPAIIAGVREAHPQARVAYVMTDGGALPAAFSRAVEGLRRAGWLQATITVGQAYGGELEAVNVHTGLLAARHVVCADLAVVAQGPGNLGTGTRWGFSGVAAGEALNAVHVLGGRGVAALRVSGADQRARHRGISHHSLTAYGRVALRPAALPVPVLPEGDPQQAELAGLVRDQARRLAAAAAHLGLHEVATGGLLEALGSSPVRLSTMGRGLEADPAAFLAAAAAGRYAATLLE